MTNSIIPLLLGSESPVNFLGKESTTFEYLLLVFIFLAYFTPYNGLQFHPSH